MGHTAKTALFVITAAALVALAIWLKPGGVSDAVYDDQGTEFFPDFKDIAKVRELEIRTMDRLTGALKVLEMQRGDKGWVLSSQDNYPADMLRSIERLASFVGRSKEVVAGDTPGSHGQYGVLDPQDPKSAGKDGVGRRYTFKSSGREVLADFIVGKPVPSREGYCFVRIPNRDRVYETQLDLTLSYPAGASNWLDTDFIDWVDIDPMKFSQQQIKKITLNRYDIQEQRQMFGENVNIVGREVIEITRTMQGEPAKPVWSLTDLNPAIEEANKEAIEALATAIDTFTIEGATKKPDMLAEWYRDNKVPFLPVKANDIGALKGGNQPGQRLIWVPSSTGTSTGFLMEEAGPRLLANLGEVIMELDSGLRYVLRIGELSGTLTGQAGTGESGAEGAAPVVAGGKPLRYVIVDVEYDDALMPEPQAPVKPQILVEEEERKQREEAERTARANQPAPPEETPGKPTDSPKPEDPTKPADPAKPTESDQDAPAPETPAPATPGPIMEDPAATAARAEKEAADAAAAKARDEALAKATNEYSQAMSKYTSARDKWTKDKTENTKRMNELKERYKDWIFLFPEELVGKTQKSRAELVKPKQ